MVKEAIILAGGLGPRLRSVLTDMPKCMAIVKGRPFLTYLIDYYKNQGIEKFIFSVGYKYESIQNYLMKEYSFLNYQLSIEDTPLGTGGAIIQACKKIVSDDVLVLNGDTLFKVDITSLYNLHQSENADCTISLKPMKNASRYGTVELNEKNRIIRFSEKMIQSGGLINGGVYILKKNGFDSMVFPKTFSFENEYLEKYVSQKKIMGCVQTNFFIDIGIPADYFKAQKKM